MNKLNKPLLGILIFITGCVPSLRGISNERNTIFVKDLLGQWTNDDGDDIWVFTKKDKKGYDLVVTDASGKKGKFTVKLVNINDSTFLEMFPAEMVSNQSDYYRIHFFPVHTFILAQVSADKLKLAFMDPDASKEFLKKNPKATEHQIIKDRILLTDSKKQLRKFLANQKNNPDIFTDPQTYSKKPKPVRINQLIQEQKNPINSKENIKRN